MKKTERILAWHFTRDMKLLDRQPLVVGKTYCHKGPVVMCDQGYHASERLIDALRYAPGAQVSRVEVWGDIQRDDDKLVGRNRKVLWTLDATMILHEFACRVAEQALAKVENPDPRSLEAIRIKRLWVQGKATDDELLTAYEAAYAGAYATARAAYAGARAGACATARVTARVVDNTTANALLTDMIEQAHKEAGND